MDIDSPSTNTSSLIKDEESHQPRKSKFSEDRLNVCYSGICIIFDFKQL